MRMSGSITLGLLSATMLTAGCGGASPRTTAAGRVLYDASRTPVPRSQWLGPDRKPRPLFDENGNPVPEAEVLAAYNSTASYSSGSSTGYRRSSVWWGPSFYTPRPTASPWSPNYQRPSPTSSAGPGRTYFGGSRPNSSPSSSSSSSSSRSWFGGSSSSSSSHSSSSGGSVSRGGIGGSGSHSSGSSSS